MKVEQLETMHAGTLIEDLIAAVERAEARARDVGRYNVRTGTRVEDDATEAVLDSSFRDDHDLTEPAFTKQEPTSSDLRCPLRTLDGAVSLVAAEDFPLANAHIRAVPTGRDESIWAP